MPKCIICCQEHTHTTIEHIVPRSLGNIHYILPKGKVCSNCNNRFARFEHEVVSSAPFMERRIKAGVTKSVDIHHNKTLRPKELNLFLVKVAFESIYRSRKPLIEQLDLDGLRMILLDKHSESNLTILQDFHPVKRLAKLLDHWRLQGSGIGLYLDPVADTFMFTFRYYDMSFTIDIKKAARWRLYNL